MFKVGDKVRALRDTGRTGRGIEVKEGEIKCIVGICSYYQHQGIYFIHDGKGQFNPKDFELYETKEGVKVETKQQEPQYEIY